MRNLENKSRLFQGHFSSRDLHVDIVASLDKCSLEPEDWSFMVDSNHAGNTEVHDC